MTVVPSPRIHLGSILFLSILFPALHSKLRECRLQRLFISVQFVTQNNFTCTKSRKRFSQFPLEGWCVGCNPPFVFCGIRLSGLPAPFRQIPHKRLFALSTCRTIVSPQQDIVGLKGASSKLYFLHSASFYVGFTCLLKIKK
jgi:hypothetical protein